MGRSTFKIGDKVQIVNYGTIMWISKDMCQQFGGISKKWVILKDNGTYYTIDTMPEIIGKKGIVVEILDNRYALSGVKGGYYAWYDKEQLKLLNNDKV